MNKVVHFEIPADDIARATSFYEEVFDWKLDKMGNDDVFLATTTPSTKKGPKDPGAINGDIFKRTHQNAHPSVVMDVESIDAYFLKIEKAGGKKITDKQEIPGVGFYASFEDTEGNVLGLWESIK